jgi:hypothetical protein
MSLILRRVGARRVESVLSCLTSPPLIWQKEFFNTTVLQQLLQIQKYHTSVHGESRKSCRRKNMLTLQDFGQAISARALRAPFFLGSLAHTQNGALRVPHPSANLYIIVEEWPSQLGFSYVNRTDI